MMDNGLLILKDQYKSSKESGWGINMKKILSIKEAEEFVTRDSL